MVRLYILENKKVRLKSLELYDWLLVGWKYESVGAPKDELLEETLYTRNFSISLKLIQILSCVQK